MSRREQSGAQPPPATSQWSHPRGIAGRIAGRLMAAANHGMNALVVDLLDIASADRVLEIGFGPGRMVQMLAARAAAGHVAGVDVSPTMVAQASARNRAAIAAGRVDLRCGGVSALPFADADFHKACAVNTHDFWPDPPADLREIRRVLTPGGLLALAVRVKIEGDRSYFSRLGYSADELERVRTDLAAGGFRIEREIVQAVRLMTACCFLARPQHESPV